MKKNIYIISLHLGFGGIEKAITNMANLFCEDYKVIIKAVYKVDDRPAYPLDPRVQVEYMTTVVPNKEDFLDAVKHKKVMNILKEGFKSLKILYLKKNCVKQAIKNIQDGILITTRNEDNILLSKYGNPNVHKIAQLHQDYTTDKHMSDDFAHKYNNIDDFLVLTKQLEEEIRLIMKDNKHTKISTVPNFIDHVVCDVSLDKKENYVISVGRLHDVKGFDRLLPIFKQVVSECPDWKLILIGDGEKKANLQQQILELDIADSVIMTGKLSSNEIEEWEKRSSIYLMTSHSEGLPLVLIEAFSCKLPAIAFDVRVGPRAVIDQGINGYLIPDDNIAAYYQCVIDLIQDEHKRKILSEAAYVKVNEFSKEHVHDLWYDIFLEGEVRDDKKV